MNMDKMMKELFGPVRADEGLKERTRAFLAEQTRGYTRARTENRGYALYAGACACLLVLLLGGHWLYFTPTARISVDINPSLELDINRFDQVISVTGFNDDGRELSDTLDVKYKNYAAAIEQLLAHDTIAALLSDSEVMTITVVGPDEQRSAELLSGVEACTAGRSDTYCFSAHSEEVAGAHELGLSCGKYRAFLELRQLDPDITPEAVQGMTMREIRDRINSLLAGSGGVPPSIDDTGETAGHHGHGGDHGHGWKTGY